MTNPPVTVLMSVWNAEATLAAAIDSILQQSFSDFEFLIFDDGSTDGSAKILEAKAAADPRIRLIRQANQGLSATLQKGLELAKGKYVFRQDSDDLSHPERIARMLPALENAPLAISGWQNLYENGHTEQPRSSRVLISLPALARSSLLSLVNLAAHGTYAMHRETALGLGGYRPFFALAQDYDLLLRFQEKGGIAVVPEALYTLRIHSGSLSRSKAARQKEFAALASLLAWERKQGGNRHLSGNSATLRSALEERFPCRAFFLNRILNYRYRNENG